MSDESEFMDLMNLQTRTGDWVRAMARYAGKAEVSEFWRSTARAARSLSGVIYARHAAGCCLHVAIDDGNYEDEHVQSCARFAYQRGHRECIALAALLLMVPEDSRARFMGDE